MKSKTIQVIGAIIMIFSSNFLTAYAQTSISLSQNVSYYSNSFYNYRQLPDVNDYIGLRISHIFESEKIQSQVYYNGDVNIYKNYAERLYHNQAIGYNGYYESEDQKRINYFGANWFLHDGRENYDIYDLQEFELYGNMRFYLRTNVIGRVGYILSNRSYSELKEFSYWQHYLFARFNTYFQSGTSLTANFNYGIKDYIPLQSYSGRGRQMMVDYTEMPSVDQLVSSFKIAQSMGAKTSVSFEYFNRMNPGLVPGAVSVLNSDELFTEDELFDDRYGYEGHEIDFTINHFLPKYVKLELGARQLWKNYLNRQVYNIDGNYDYTNDNRNDVRTIFWGEFSRSFAVNRGIKTVRLSLSGGYLKNESNDRYYQFDNYFGSLGFQFNIQ